MTSNRIYFQRLKISKFRGIISELDISFQNLDKKVSSALIVGDNGSGKSSIIDSIEFVTQGAINHQPLKSSLLQEVFSQFSNNNPKILIELSNGDTIEKEIYLDEENVKDCKLINGSPKKYFRFCPFVLRRSDILLFWETPDVQRQKLFWNFVSGFDPSFIIEEDISVPDKFQIKDINQKIVKLKKERDDSKQKVAIKFSLPIDDIPNEPHLIFAFIKENVHHGIKNKLVPQFVKDGRIHVDKEKENICFEYLKIQLKLRELHDEIKKVHKENKEPIDKRKEYVKIILTKVSEKISKAFIKLSNTTSFVEKIELLHSDKSEISITFKVTLKNGIEIIPEKIFSEANLDMLAFIIFTELIKEGTERGQPKILVLDDVFQSVDSSIRLKVIDYLLTECEDWQFIISVHDRLWEEQLIQLFRKKNFPLLVFEILKWDSIVGPTITTESSLIEDIVKKQLTFGGITEICTNSSILFEKICDNLSYRLPISVTRKHNDKYTIGDLWPSIVKELKNTNISDTIDKMDSQIYMRNIMGGHFNEWAMSISREEAQEYSKIILELYFKIKCDECHRWIEEIRIGDKSTKKWSCRCGKIIVEKIQK